MCLPSRKKHLDGDSSSSHYATPNFVKRLLNLHHLIDNMRRCLLDGVNAAHDVLVISCMRIRCTTTVSTEDSSE
jgi:hypothetical protein